jgi:deoxyribonuclease V
MRLRRRRQERADVCYLRCGGARAAAGTAGDAAFSAVQAEWTMLVPAVLPYRPGEFFLRELPLRTVLARVRTLGLLVIDGDADLDPGGRPGLGTHAHAAFGIPVIDVAKTWLHGASHAGRLAGQRQVKPP